LNEKGGESSRVGWLDALSIHVDLLGSKIGSSGRGHVVLEVFEFVETEGLERSSEEEGRRRARVSLVFDSFVRSFPSSFWTRRTVLFSSTLEIGGDITGEKNEAFEQV